MSPENNNFEDAVAKINNKNLEQGDAEPIEFNENKNEES